MQPKQPTDPIIDEVREVRHQISKRCGHDPERLVEYYMKLQQQYDDRLIDPPVPPTTPDQSAA